MITIFIAEKGSGDSAHTNISEPFIGFNGSDLVYVESKTSAIFALCRELVALGLPDQPWISYRRPKVPSMRGGSIHKAALMTVLEDGRLSARFARWNAYPRTDNQIICGHCGDGRQVFKMVCLTCRARKFDGFVSRLVLVNDRLVGLSILEHPLTTAF